MNRKGVTLIELIVVFIIVAILAAAAIPLMRGFVQRAAATEAHNILGTIRTAQAAYFVEHQTYADTLADLDLITAQDVSGRYYEFNRLENVDASDFTAVVHGVADSVADGRWVSMNSNGDLNDGEITP